MKVLVTGADGFAGAWLVRTLLAAGHSVIGTTVMPEQHRRGILGADEALAVEWRVLELGSNESVLAAVAAAGPAPDAIVHLAAIASSRVAGQDPVNTWDVNAVGTVRLLEAIQQLRERGADPLLLLASTAEVYGRSDGSRARSEQDPVVPVSPYAASKAGAEIALAEAVRRTGLRAIVARPFPHTGPGQQPIYVAPTFLRKLREAKAAHQATVGTGRLETVRDFLDVRDVAAAYLALLERGVAGETYNIASGTGQTLQRLFDLLAGLVQVTVRPLPEESQMRPWDLPHLVGDPTKLRAATGWAPRYTFEQTLTDLVHAEAH